VNLGQGVGLGSLGRGRGEVGRRLLLLVIFHDNKKKGRKNMIMLRKGVLNFKNRYLLVDDDDDDSGRKRYEDSWGKGRAAQTGSSAGDSQSMSQSSKGTL
jgi:hypothetical protein